MEFDVKSLRARVAASGIQYQQFADMAGIGQQKLSAIMHGHEGVGPIRRARLEAALDELDRNPPERRVVRRGKTRAERLREEQLASGAPSVHRIVL